MKKKIFFITSNDNKLDEARDILSDYDIESAALEIEEIQGDRHDVIKHKAGAALKEVEKPLFVEDVNLCFDALNGLPGPYVKDFVEIAGAEKMASMLSGFDNKKAKAIAMIAYAIPGKEPLIFEGIVEGEIVGPKGKNGFGFDSIFKPSGSEKTFAELSPEEKNNVSHRKKALMLFKEYLENEN